MLSFADPLPTTIDGQLLDISDGGFRAAHGYAGMRTGLEIDFAHALLYGKARVVWNRISGGVTESGFIFTGTPTHGKAGKR